MRHGLTKALVQWFHVETDTFHLSCREYAILSLDLMAILGLRFGTEPVPTKFVSFVVASELLGIPYSLTRVIGRYFGLTKEPQIHMQWLEQNVPWVVELDNVAHRRFFFYFISSYLLGNNRSVLTCRLLVGMRVVFVIEAYD